MGDSTYFCKQRAITLVEILTVVGILIILAALIYPLGRSAVLKAREAQTVSNLRQLHMAVMIYQENEGFAGTTEGLMPREEFILLAVKEWGMWPPGPLSGTPIYGQYYYYPTRETDPGNPIQIADEWKKTLEICGDEAIMIADFTFSDQLPDWGDPYQESYGIGIRINGAIDRLRSRGDPIWPAWWGCSEDRIRNYFNR